MGIVFWLPQRGAERGSVCSDYPLTSLRRKPKITLRRCWGDAPAWVGATPACSPGVGGLSGFIEAEGGEFFGRGTQEKVFLPLLCFGRFPDARVPGEELSCETT